MYETFGYKFAGEEELKCKFKGEKELCEYY